MSESAKTLMHYVNNWRYCCADDSDRHYCEWCARAWAAEVIGEGC